MECVSSSPLNSNLGQADLSVSTYRQPLQGNLYGQYLTSDFFGLPSTPEFQCWGGVHVCLGDDGPTGPSNFRVGEELRPRRFFFCWSAWLQGAARRTTLKLGGGGQTLRFSGWGDVPEVGKKSEVKY